MTIKIRTGAPASRVLGLGAYRPSRVVTNAEVIEWIDSSDEWIRTRSGIEERRWALPHETISMMSQEAARQAIAQAGIEPTQIDAVIVATVTHMHQTPAIATTISHELGIGSAVAFDISAACAGFCVGIGMADSMVRAGSAGHVLVIGVERLSDMTDKSDRSTAFIFSDGAGAAVVGPSDVPGIGPVIWGSDGGQAGLIGQTEAWDTAIDRADPAAKAATWPMLRMEGNPVFKWAAFEMAKTAADILELSGVRPEELDLFVPHQANNRITDAMVRTLKLPETVTVGRDIKRQGNASAASVPLAIQALMDSGEAKSGQTCLIIGFGAGLIYAGQVITLP